MSDRVTICTLFFGDYPELAARCLDPLAKLVDETGVSVRIGTNAVGEATHDMVMRFMERRSPVHVLSESVNTLKYPMMRRLFYGSGASLLPITTPYVMWFDDDSYLRSPTKAWLDHVMASIGSAAQLGSIYSQTWRGNQKAWVQAQPWYTGRSFEGRKQANFVQGAWWVAEMAFLESINYPWPELQHRGGDVMLGEAIFQQGRRLSRYNHNVGINADKAGRESESKRRGHDEPSIGENFVVQAPAPLPVVSAAAPVKKGRALPRF